MPLEPSNEATRHQLALARREGDAFGAAIAAMAEEDGIAIREVDDYRIGVAVEKAEGMWRRLDDDSLTWSQPDERHENAHVEVVVADRADGRFIPELDITAEIRDLHGGSLGRKPMPFLWHPFLYHYGHNWYVPVDGLYTISVVIDAPSFFRHDPVNGKRYARRVEVNFDQIEIHTGVKHSTGPTSRTAATGPVV